LEAGPSGSAIVASGSTSAVHAVVALLAEAEASAYSSDENGVETPPLGGGIEAPVVLGGRFSERSGWFLLDAQLIPLASWWFSREGGWSVLTRNVRTFKRLG